MRGLPPKAFPSGGRWPEGPDEGTPPKSLPPRGEGGWPSGQTDEGAMIEQFRFLQGGFAACGRRVTLPRRLVVAKSTRLRFRLVAKTALVPLLLLFRRTHFVGLRREVRERLPKTPPGTAPDEHFVLIVAHPIPSVATRHLPLTGGVGPGPHLRGLPLEVGRILPAHKIRVLGCHSVRPHWGPEREENWDWCGFASAPAVSEPTLPVCCPP